MSVRWNGSSPETSSLDPNAAGERNFAAKPTQFAAKPEGVTIAERKNDANVLAMGARVIASAYAREIVVTWLATPFEGGRHTPRIEQIAAIEREEIHDA